MVSNRAGKILGEDMTPCFGLGESTRPLFHSEIIGEGSVVGWWNKTLAEMIFCFVHV